MTSQITYEKYDEMEFKVTVVQITKEESMEIRKRFPETHIHITSKQTNHKRYWVEENGAVKRYLREKRGVTTRG